MGLVITSLIAVNGLQTVKGLMRDTNTTKVQLNTLNEIQEDFLEARLDLLRFLGDRNWAIDDETIGNLHEILDFQDQNFAIFEENAEVYPLVVDIYDLVTQYDANVHDILDVRDEFQNSMQSMLISITDLQARLSQVENRASENSSFMIAGALDMAKQNLELLTQQFGKFNLAPIDENAERMTGTISLLSLSVDRFENGAPPSWAENLSTMRAHLANISAQLPVAQQAEAVMVGILQQNTDDLGPRTMEMLDITWDALSAQTLAQTTRVDQTIKSSEIFSLGTMGAVFVTGIIISLLLARSVIGPLTALRNALEAIANNSSDVDIPSDRKDEFGAIARSVEVIQERAVEALQIRNAVDNSSAKIIIAGPDDTIVYTTDMLQKMFHDYEEDLRSALPNLSVSNLVGTPIGMFDPEKMGVDSAHTRALQFGSRRYLVNVSPVVDDANNRLGTVMEWQDRTDELRIQSEVDEVLRHALNGEFDRRIDARTDNKTLSDLAGNVNGLVAAFDEGMRATTASISALAAGDFSGRMEGSYRGAFATLQADINSTFSKLGELVSDIQITAHEINSNTGQIATDSKSLSRRTESQAASLEETAATMEEMTSTIKNNAQNAEAATKLATEAADQANVGGRVVENAVSAMSRIEDSSEKMSQIISVIDSIAFQTNLLALNAAVEAARAGDAGKGFAVVASEVRTLAQRSSEAAKDIKELISFSTTHVSEGVDLVSEAGKSLEKIISAIQEVNNAITDITAMSKEQATGVDEISSALSEMDSMTQQNAAMSEQSAERSTQLALKAETLIDLVRVFKTSKQVSLAQSNDGADRFRDDKPATPARKPSPAPVVVGNTAVDHDDWKEF
ncbi:methyl-accepting chemotaxis protein [Rubricella aquisinus]|uniref:Methyl-accepting chemotaxis protein n=1 Tax=Rubricella aquisinus TaxID=2028108 RepID=A0A840WPY6_9RHOB|nr:methyl-accepting chemotaxis protein [Rubricella aquisinus]